MQDGPKSTLHFHFKGLQHITVMGDIFEVDPLSERPGLATGEAGVVALRTLKLLDTKVLKLLDT